MELEVLDGTGCCRQQPECPPSLCHPGARQVDVTQAPTGHSVPEHVRMVLIFQSNPENLQAREAWAASVLKDRIPSSGACVWLRLKPVFIPRKGARAHTRGRTCTHTCMRTPHALVHTHVHSSQEHLGVVAIFMGRLLCAGTFCPSRGLLDNRVR